MLTEYRNHLLSIRKAPGTIRLRMLHIRKLETVHPQLEAVTQKDLEAYLAMLTENGLASESLKSYRSSFRSFYEWASDAGEIDTDPSVKLKPVIVRVRMPRVAPDDAIIQAASHAPLRERAMIFLARLACLRLSELTTLPKTARTGSDLLILGKGEKERIVSANDQLLDTLIELERETRGETHYFPGGARARLPHMHPMSVNKIIKRVTGWNPHSLRHAGATAAYRATRDLRAVQEFLGHESLQTTQRYLHLDDEARRAVAAATTLRRA